MGEPIKDFERICLRCGNVVNLHDRYCTNCGYYLDSYKDKDLVNKYKSLIKDKQLLAEDINSLDGIMFENDYLKRRNSPKISLYSRTKTNRLVNDYVVFDLETTGFNPNEDEIIEIGALKYKDGLLVDTFDILINPKKELSRKIIKLTGITDEMLANCDTIDVVMPQFLAFIEDLTLVAHNGSFDLGFIEAKVNTLGLKMPENSNIDTLYLARKYIPELRSHRLEILKEYFNLKYGSHRALEDCYVTNFVYDYCKIKDKEKVVI